jgi:pimeloyl-ACP methyl ester carboxylesterase
MEQFIRDGIELAEYLRRRLKKDRLLLFASSFGSTFGLEMARRRPDLFYAYIGTDQNVGMMRGRERGCYESIVENWTVSVHREQLFPVGLMVTATKFARPWLVYNVITDG